MILTFRQLEITLESYCAIETTTELTRQRPIVAEFLHIYQRVPFAMSGDTWAVLRDVIIDGKRNEANEILACDDVMPGWRRSNVMIDRFQSWGKNTMPFSQCLAGVVWDINLNEILVRSEGYQLALRNPYEIPITVRPYIVCREMDDEELRQTFPTWRG